jgi:H+/gluconate symporter-like permease
MLQDYLLSLCKYVIPFLNCCSSCYLCCFVLLFVLFCFIVICVVLFIVICVFYIRIVLLLIVMFCVLFVCKCVLPPGVYPIAVDKYINININFLQCDGQ